MSKQSIIVPLFKEKTKSVVITTEVSIYSPTVEN